MIPAFDAGGNLPPGIHAASWEEIVTRYATNTRRRELADGLLDALRSLKHAGCRTAHLDGSFVTAKNLFQNEGEPDGAGSWMPGDARDVKAQQCCVEHRGWRSGAARRCQAAASHSETGSKELPGDFDACWEVAGVDPALVDAELLDFSDRRAAQKARYGGELFPAETAAEPAGTTFLDYFQRDRSTGQPKGIVAIDLGALR